MKKKDLGLGGGGAPLPGRGVALPTPALRHAPRVPEQHPASLQRHLE